MVTRIGGPRNDRTCACRKGVLTARRGSSCVGVGVELGEAVGVGVGLPPPARLNAPIRSRQPFDAGRGNVLVDIPESLSLTRIEIDCRVIPPAIRSAGLRTRPVDNGSFAEGHLARRITCMSGGIKYAREQAGFVPFEALKPRAISPSRVHGNTAHPPMNPIRKPRCIGAFLKDDRAAIGAAQFPPANA